VPHLDRLVKLREGASWVSAKGPNHRWVRDGREGIGDLMERFTF
jgi:hypothetical protein